MSYAIYGESLGYVHLVSAKTAHDVVSAFFQDIESVNVSIKEIYNVAAVNGVIEDIEIVNHINQKINEAKQ